MLEVNGVTAHTQLSGVTVDQHHTQLHRAAHINGGGDNLVQFAKLGADNTYTNTTTLSAVGMPLTLAAQRTYRVRFCLYTNQNNITNDAQLKVALNLTSGAQTFFSMHIIYWQTAMTALIDVAALAMNSPAIGGNNSTTQHATIVECIITTDVAGAVIDAFCAQNIAFAATSTVVKQNSWATAEVIG